MQEQDRPYIRTFTGRKFYPDRIEDLDVCIEDIAHHLSNMNRYTGALNHFYSVAQHCLIVEHVVSKSILSPEIRLAALLHDASEAYLPDFPSPWKSQIPRLKEIEKRLERHIYKHFKIYDNHYTINDIDKNIRLNEMKYLTDWPEGKQELIYKYKIIPMSAKFAEEEYLKKYYELRGETNENN